MLIAVVLLLLAPIFFAFRVWLEVLDQRIDEKNFTYLLQRSQKKVMLNKSHFSIS